MRAYSRDLRIRVLNAYLNEEGSQREIARRFEVSRGFVQNVLRRYSQTGDVERKSSNGSTRKKIGQQEIRVLRQLIDEVPGATLDELCEGFAGRTDIKVSVATMHRAIKSISF
jgi:transposase